MTYLRGPIRWYGGKANSVAFLLRLLPPHRVYCEPFAGGAAVFFAKPRAERELLGDIDTRVALLYTVLRDRGDEFLELARLTEYGERLHVVCREVSRDPTADPVRRAWAFWVTAGGGFSGQPDTWGYTRGVGTSRNVPRSVYCHPARIWRLRRIIARLQGCEVLCADWRVTLRRADGPDTLHYLDPPYVTSTRREVGNYAHEMTECDHRDLVGYLASGDVRGMVIISGYRSPVYEPLEAAGWVRLERRLACSAAGRTRGTRILGSGAAAERVPRVDCVWLCPRTAWALGRKRLCDLEP
jgi:DNA adenine methylase